MPRGFVKNLNLGESKTGTSDASILDNLGISPISDDVRLFAGNSRNTSVITANNYIIEDGFVVLTNNEGIIPFSNGTKLTHNGTELRVDFSDGFTRFRVYDTSNTIFTPSEDLVRKDVVLFENMKNYNAEREFTSNISGFENDEGLDDTFGLQTTLLVTDTNLYDIDLSATYSAIDNLVGLYAVKNAKTISALSSNLFSDSLNIEGVIEVIDANTAEVNTEPGIYISDGVDKIKIFSQNYQPWEQAANSIQTDSSKITVGSLKLNDPDLITANTTVESGSALDFTHKMPIEINGEQYFVLLKELL